VSEHVRLEIRDGLGRITLDRPPLNVLTTAMMRDLAEAVRAAAASREVRVVRLDASGKAFCAGVDVGEHLGEALPGMMEALAELFVALEEVPQPTVSVVHGAALGGGCELVLGTDLAVASDRAAFGQPEIRLGVFPPPATVLLPRVAGGRIAAGLLLTGDTIPAAEALRIGLVNAVFPHDRFDDEAAAWVGKLLQLSGEALHLAKRAFAAARGRPLREAHETVDRIYRDELMRTEDAREGLQAFLEKRSPSWRHR